MAKEAYLEIGDIPDNGAAFECDGNRLTISMSHLDTDIWGVDNIHKLRDFLDQFLLESTEQIAKRAEAMLDLLGTKENLQYEERVLEIVNKYCPGCGIKDRSCRCWDDS